MRTRKSGILSGCGLLAIGLMATPAVSHGQIAVNGTLDPLFGAPLAYDQEPAGFGDATTVDPNDPKSYATGSEIDATYATIQNNTLYVFFAGNLRGQGPPDTTYPSEDQLDVFIQTGTGGQNQLVTNTLNGGASPSGYNRLTGTSTGANRGLQFDSSFAPNYFFSMQEFDGGATDAINQDSNIYMNYANLNTGDAGYLGASNPGIGTISGSANQGIQATLDNSNVLGVTATSVPSQAALAAVNTGMEFAIPLSDITEAGQTLSTIEITGMIATHGQDYISNQVVGLQPGYPAADGSGNLGDPTYAGGTNFNNDPGLQYVTLAVPAVPEPASLSLLALALPLLGRRMRRAR